MPLSKIQPQIQQNIIFTVVIAFDQEQDFQF